MSDAATVNYSTSPVAKQSDRVVYLEQKRALCRTLMGGTDAMRNARETYMPKHEAEQASTYESRLKGTTLYGGYSQTVVKQAARLFFREVVLDDDVPPAVADLCQNIDGKGRTITSFGFDLAKEAFVDGVSYILVDFPKLSGTATLADQQSVGARPYATLVPACDVLGWKTQTVAGVTTLSQIRIAECVTVDDGEYGEKVEKRVRVLTPGKFEVWVETKLEGGRVEYVLNEELSGTTTWQAITVVPFYTNQSGFMEGLPPLRELAELNAEHWVSSSEQRRALTFLRFAMLVLTGVTTDDKIAIGPDKIIRLSNAQGKAEYVEHSGSGIESGRKDLLDIEGRMHAAGMELRIENTANGGRMTATAAAIDSEESNTGLKAVAKGLESALEQVLDIFAVMLGMGVEKGGSLQVYDEFAEADPPGETKDLMGLYTGGVISRPTLWSELQRRHVLDADFNAADEETLLADTPPPLLGTALGLPAPAADPTNPTAVEPPPVPPKTKQPPKPTSKGPAA